MEVGASTPWKWRVDAGEVGASEAVTPADPGGGTNTFVARHVRPLRVKNF